MSSILPTANPAKRLRAQILNAAGLRRLAVIILVIGLAHPPRAEDGRPLPSQAAPAVQLWQFTQINDTFTRGNAVDLDLTLSNGNRVLWNPANGDVQAPAESAAMLRSGFPTSDLKPYALSNGGEIVMSIRSSGAKCGYTLGVNLIYTAKNNAPQAFYLVEKYTTPKINYPCGTKLQQAFDTEPFHGAAALPDGRLLIVDYSSRLAVAFFHVPSEIVALGNKAVLIPGDLLTPGLDAAGDDPGARYRALLSPLKRHPATPLRPILVQ